MPKGFISNDLARRELLNSIHLIVQELLSPLSNAHALSDWRIAISTLLDQLFPAKDAQTSLILEQISLFLSQLESASHYCTIGVSEGWSLLSSFASSSYCNPHLRENVIELLGWLELHLDDAPHCIILGCNEHKLPETLNADRFLPNSLREQLGLNSNRTRLSRDCFLMFSLLHSKRSILLTMGKQTLRGETLLPSRVLLKRTPQQQLPFLTTFFHQTETSSDEHQEHKVASPALQFPSPPQAPLDPIKSMSVTSFGYYLQCPYQFYLRHIKKLQDLHDQSQEMDPLSFGSYLHHLLYYFGNTPEFAELTDEKAIAAALLSLQEESSTRYFGKNAKPAVFIQLEQIKHRLFEFARWQSAWRSEGWKIIDVEHELKFALSLPPHSQMLVRGIIDRIDYNSRTGEWALLDYKTGDRAVTPQQKYNSLKSSATSTGVVSRGWKDLQLPLYRHYLLNSSLLSDTRKKQPTIYVGYASLCKESHESRIALADWGENEYNDALELAHEIAFAVQQNLFWPPQSELPR